MPNWSESMQQTFEYYTVDPATWKDVTRLEYITACSITRDEETATICSAEITTTESLAECYIRVYLVTIQNGIREKHPLGTFLVQTPSYSFDGKTKDVSLEAYSPLLELKESPPPIGYSLLEGENIMDVSYRLVREKARAPVVKATCSDTLHADFVSNTQDTWLTFISDLIFNAKYSFGLDEMGRILFLPKQDTASLQPVKTFDDGNSSILYPELTMNHDMYGIPNVVEVVYSGGGEQYYAKVVNDDPNSPISTISRGREIVYRDTNPQISGIPSQSQIDEYAERLLRDLSTLEYSVSFTHGYYPIRLGDCVRLDYSRAGLNDVKAKVISQTIKCEPGCPVSTKAVFTNKLWR